MTLLRAELNFTGKPNGALPKSWDTPAGSKPLVTGNSVFCVKNGHLRFGPLTFTEQIMSWFGAAGGGSVYLCPPTLTSPIKEIGIEYKWTSEGRKGDSQLAMAVSESMFYGKPASEAKGGLHLSIDRTYMEYSAVENQKFYFEPKVDYADQTKDSGTYYTIKANIDHATNTIVITYPGGTKTVTNERVGRLCKNDAFFEVWCVNRATDGFGDIKKIWVSAE